MVSTFFIFQTLIIKSDRIFSLEDMRITKIKCMARTLFETILIILHRSVLKSYMVGIFEQRDLVYLGPTKTIKFSCSVSG